MENNKVTICASGTFVKEAEHWKKCLQDKGFEVVKVPELLKSNYEEIHALHYQKINESDIILVLNFDKNGIKNYIGPSVFAEIAFAIGLNLSLGKKIKVLCLNEVPLNLSYSDELLLWEQAGWIHQWKEI